MKPQTLFIITTESGFTTCAVHPDDVKVEVARCSMKAPVTIFYWERSGHEHGANQGWLLIYTYSIDA